MIHNDRYISLYTWPDPQDVNYGLWVIMMCQYKSSVVTNVPLCWGDVNNSRSYACVDVGGTREISIPSPQFCCGY